MTRARVLVVDDDPAICSLLIRTLQEAGHEAHAAGCAEEAMQIVSGRPFDLALVDLVLPGGTDGAALAAQLAESGTTVLLITGHPDEMRRLDDLPYACLLKPFRSKNLLRQVGKLLRTRQAAAESGAQRPYAHPSAGGKSDFVE